MRSRCLNGRGAAAKKEMLRVMTGKCGGDEVVVCDV